MNNTQDIFEQLRGKFDGSESFMNHGHQIIKIRRGNRKNPPWVKCDTKIREILLRSFPKMLTNPLQRSRAGTWARVIHLYFRMQMTYSQVAAELNIKPRRAEDLIRSIRRAGAGRKANGKGLLGKRATGRPKKRVP
jgi:hypothetical protein